MYLMRETSNWLSNFFPTVYSVRLHNENDADIIAYLEQAMNKQGTIKEALREKMERENFHPETWHAYIM